MGTETNICVCWRISVYLHLYPYACVCVYISVYAYTRFFVYTDIYGRLQISPNFINTAKLISDMSFDQFTKLLSTRNELRFP